MEDNLMIPMSDKYQEYLSDESKLTGWAESISFPQSEPEIIEIIRRISGSGAGITIQSGKTGIAGGAVPGGGHIMNLSAMNKWLDAQPTEDGGLVRVQPGINLIELNKAVAREFRQAPMIWPPQPTETSAAVGGILASGANGIQSCHYGYSRQYVKAIRMVTSDGTVHQLKRGDSSILIDGEAVDELDLILGGEGLFGVITAAELKVLPKPEQVWGISFFFEQLEELTGFAEQIKILAEPEGGWLAAAEYLSREALDMVEARKANMTKIKELPDIPEQFIGMVYLELAGAEAAIEELAETVMELAAECGSDPDQAWAVIGETEVEKMHVFRHAAAETANLFIEEVRRSDERIAKVGTDMSLPDYSFEEALMLYRADIEQAGLKASIFGHISGGHLHVNLLPADYQEYHSARELVQKWAEIAAAGAGRQIITEHGFGKLKSHLTELALSPQRIAAIKALKEKYDPLHLWNRGNVFPEDR